ncbi:MAG: transglycosylase domain-containing protein [Firmicutes bacterium]|nr:transglycosylase domain-containing protein [Bacillota bacterium]
MKKFFLVTSIMFFTFALTVGLSWVAIYNSHDLDAAKLFPCIEKAIIYDANGNTMNQYKTAPIPDHMRNAIIAVEDKNFHDHRGLSYNRIAKAAYKNAAAKRAKEGASTISQQLIKNTHLTSEKTMRRKIKEAVLATKLEKKYSKDQILDMYMDIVYFGNNIFGVHDAARFYFGTDISDIDIRQAAGLAGLLRSPGRYNPISQKERFDSRTNLVLAMMYAQGHIEKDDYESARVKTTEIKGRRGRSDSQSYQNAVIAQAASIVGNKTDIKIHTYFVSSTQSAILDVINDPEYTIKNTSDNRADFMTIASNTDGGIKALATNHRMMPNAKRNFASAVKPLVVFAPAIEHNIVSPDTMIDDSPYVTGDFQPRNHDNTHRGRVTVRESLAKSHNIPAVKVLEYTTVPRAVSTARGLGLDLTDNETIAMSLGATKNGQTAMEVLGAYCTIASGGERVYMSFIRQITDMQDRIIWEHEPRGKRVLSAETVATVTDMMRSAVTEGTARKLGSLDFDIAAKTGTAERQGHTTNTDAINISYTPDTVLLVWNGNANMRPENDLPKGTTGGGVTSFIARDIMKRIAAGEPFTHTGVHDEGLSNPPVIEPVLPQTPLAPTVTAKTGPTGAPIITFDAIQNRTYKIFRNVNGLETLLQVIRPQTTTYTFVDTTAPTRTIIEYHVTLSHNDQELSSNIVRVFTADSINRSVSMPTARHWFF